MKTLRPLMHNFLRSALQTFMLGNKISARDTVALAAHEMQELLKHYGLQPTLQMVSSPPLKLPRSSSLLRVLENTDLSYRVTAAHIEISTRTPDETLQTLQEIMGEELQRA